MTVNTTAGSRVLIRKNPESLTKSLIRPFDLLMQGLSV